MVEMNNVWKDKTTLKKRQKIVLRKLFPQIVWRFKKIIYLCTRISTETELQTLVLGYGVMVTLQILVLSFLVRVRVPQL